MPSLNTRSADRVAGLFSRFNSRTYTSGTPWLLPTERFAVSMDWGTFQGTNALALTAAVRLGTNVQANGGLAYGANGGGASGRAGVRVGW